VQAARKARATSCVSSKRNGKRQRSAVASCFMAAGPSCGYEASSLELTATTASPWSRASCAARTSSLRMCFTYGQWLQMNATSSPFLPRASSAPSTGRPVTASARRKAGSWVPSGSIVEGVSAMRAPLRSAGILGGTGAAGTHFYLSGSASLAGAVRRVATIEPARMSTKASAVPRVNRSPPSPTPAATATAGFT
jgi:hypothetical protein